MTVYMTHFTYTAETAKALAQNPEDRSIPLKALAEKLGGRLIGMWYMFGEYDGVVIYEAPDNVSAATAVFAANLGGANSATKTTVLFTIEEAMSAIGQAGKIIFKAPQG